MEPINELATALAKAQAAMPAASKDSLNPHFKSRYADLASIWTAAREALTSNGLSVVQLPLTHPDTGQPGIQTLLLHTSGQQLTSEPLYAPSVQNVQQLGSALTYLRRYSLAAMVGIVADDDDDGAAASAPTPSRQERPRPQPPRSSEPTPNDEIDFDAPPPKRNGAPQTTSEAKRRFYEKFGDDLGGSDWKRVLILMGDDFGPEPITVADWMDTGRKVAATLALRARDAA